MEATVCTWLTFGNLLVGLSFIGIAQSQVCRKLRMLNEIPSFFFFSSLQHVQCERRDSLSIYLVIY